MELLEHEWEVQAGRRVCTGERGVRGSYLRAEGLQSRSTHLEPRRALVTDPQGREGPSCCFLSPCFFCVRNSGPDHPERLYSNQRSRGIYGITSG